MDDRMIMFTHDGLTFMYRVGGIAIHDGRVLVEQAVGKGFCFLPGGRVEFGESAIAALQREIREELGEQAEVGRLLIAADSLFELDGRRYQEVNLYFLVEARRRLTDPRPRRHVRRCRVQRRARVDPGRRARARESQAGISA